MGTRGDFFVGRKKEEMVWLGSVSSDFFPDDWDIWAMDRYPRDEVNGGVIVEKDENGEYKAEVRTKVKRDEYVKEAMEIVDGYGGTKPEVGFWPWPWEPGGTAAITWDGGIVWAPANRKSDKKEVWFDINKNDGFPYNLMEDYGWYDYEEHDEHDKKDKKEWEDYLDTCVVIEWPTKEELGCRKGTLDEIMGCSGLMILTGKSA